jgi:RNA polymerase sigma-70 factor (ECF subfamily)
VASLPENVDDRFHRLLREYGPAIERLASAYETDPNEREDLMQEIVFALWNALPSFRGECSERTFAFRIAQNRGLTHRWRRRRRSNQLVDLNDVSEIVDPHTVDESPPREIGRDELVAAVQRLQDLQRDVMVLNLEGLTNGEIAEVMGISEGNVAVRLSRGRAALRAILTSGSRP